MSTPPPPPSYDSVISDIQAQIQGLSDPVKILAAVSNLDPSQTNVLVNNSDQAATSLTPAQHAAVAVGMASTMSDNSNQQTFLESAQSAADAAKLCELGFVNLVPRLSAVDAKNIPPKEGPFLPRFQALHQRYFDLINQSAVLATSIATYANGFEALILPFCASTTISTADRLTTIEQWEQQATDIGTQADQMQTAFFTLKSDFDAFVGTFQSWAADKIGQLQAQVKELDQELTSLNSKLAKINASLIAFGALTAAALPVTGVVAAMSGPAAPLVIVGGLIVAGVSLAITVGLVAGRISVQNEISSTQAQRDGLAAEITALQKTQQDLVTIGNSSMEDVNTGIGTLMGTWGSVQTDCVSVKSWLSQGATVVQMPSIMTVALQDGNSVYKTMAAYLTAYATGINSAGIKPPQYIAHPTVRSVMGKLHF